MGRFDDVDAEGSELDDELSDRALFHAIEVRLEAGDLAADDAWGMLAERYPDEPRLRLGALAADLDANFVRDWFASTVEALAPRLDERDRPALAGAIAIAFEGLRAEDEAVRARVRPLVDAWPRNLDEARNALRAFVARVLEEADERTQGGRPFAEPKAASATPATAEASGPARPYRPTEAFARGDRLVHPKFGEGLVLGAAEGKIDVLFGVERKRLVAKA